MAYRAIRSEPDDARGEMTRLWAENLPVATDLDARFRWFYREVPDGAASAFLLSSQEEGQPARVVGCAGVGPRAFHFQGRPLQAALLADLAVDKSHRSALPALTMQRAVRDYTRQGFDFLYGFPNERAVAIHLRLGFHLLGKMERWVRVLRHRAYLARVVRLPFAPTIGGALLDTAFAAIDAGRALPVLSSRRLEWIDDAGEVDRRFDALWEAARDRYPLLARRNAAFVRWRHLGKVSDRIRIAALHGRGSDELLGYAAVRDRGEAAEVIDLFTRDDEETSHLLALLLLALRRRGFSSASVSCLGGGALPSLLSRHGFELRDANRAVIVDAGRGFPFDPALLKDRQNFYLLDSDEDT